MVGFGGRLDEQGHVWEINEMKGEMMYSSKVGRCGRREKKSGGSKVGKSRMDVIYNVRGGKHDAQCR